MSSKTVSKLTPTKTPFDIHIKELRSRLFIALLAYLIAVCICFYYATAINNFLLSPLVQVLGNDYGERKLIFTGLSEGFFNHMRIAMYAGFALAFPFIAWQVYFFIAPGLYRAEKRIFLPALLAAPILFCMGAWLAYYYVMPMAWQFFLSFEQHSSLSSIPIVLEARVSEYLSLALELIISFGLAFQLPLIMAILVYLGIINTKALTKQRRYAIVIIFIIAAIMTPPDVISQIALATPLLLLYEISLLICRNIETKRRYRARHKNNP